MRHSLGSVKIGVAGASKRNTRIANHRRNGWELVRQLRFPSGELARQVEQNVLARIRNEYQLNSFMSADTMPQGGWTETFDADIISATSLVGMVQDGANRTKAQHEREAVGDKPLPWLAITNR